MLNSIENSDSDIDIEEFQIRIESRNRILVKNIIFIELFIRFDDIVILMEISNNNSC